MSITINVTESGQGERLDNLVSKEAAITRSRVKTLIESGLVTLNNQSVKQGARLHIGDTIEVFLPSSSDNILIPEDINLDISYQDNHLIVINKPAGMVMYPAPGNPSGTLLNAVAGRVKELPDIGSPLRAGVVHRIDKDTSGLVVIALDNQSYYGLVQQFKSRTIKRSYIAIVNGRIKGDQGSISASIGRSQSNRKKMSTVSRHSRPAVTNWRVIERFNNATMIEARLITGRTHQIRVHLSSIGHSLLGDVTYGNKTVIGLSNNNKFIVSRQMLHAKTLGFIHPVTSIPLEFTSHLPDDMVNLIGLFNGFKGRVSDPF
ncbi:MAG: RluA family pseudouridine synthase [Nitrospirae bacterium]|nr:RluA family pseudouridine synthase [Nitrospirota bacterium]